MAHMQLEVTICDLQLIYVTDHLTYSQFFCVE